MIRPNPLQQEAIEYLQGPLLVLAGPGTGKTQLLSARVAYILSQTDTAPENILCLTFTENGAANMRERLNSVIGPASRHVNIHTYHAFGQSIIAQYKNYNPIYERRLDDTVDDVTKFKIIHQIQEKLEPFDILKGDNPSDIIDTISSAKSARLTPDDLAKIAQINTEESALISSEITPVLAALRPRMKFADAITEIYAPILEILQQHQNPTPITGQVEHLANILARALGQLIAAEGNKEKPSVSPLTKWKNATFERDDAGNYRLSGRVANLKLASLANIMRQYNTYLKNHNLYDFDDMIEEAIKFLQSDTGFRLTLSERYQYILLDEFQDTNPSQLEIIKLLTDYDSPSVMAVGDDDQAIFEFQGANASNLLDFQSHYQAKIIVLTDNYRSTTEILEFSRRIATQIDSSFAKKRQITKILTAVRHPHLQGPHATISRHEFISADAEYYWVAEQIAGLIENGEDPSEIAVITPKHKYIAPLLPYLQAHDNIQIAYEKKSDVLADPQIHQLIRLSQFIADLAAGRQIGHHILEILSYPCWGLNYLHVLEAVHQARTEKKNIMSALASSEDQDLAALAQWFTDLAAASHTLPLEQFLDRLVKGIGEDACPENTAYAPNYHIFQLYNNLTTLRSALIRHAGTPNPHLSDLLNFVSDYELAGAPLTSTSPYQDSDRAVQVMTAFKSKGLEFKHVFLIAVDDLSWGKAKGNNNTLTLPKNLIQIRHTNITDDERLRILFVALTRARSHLTLTNSIRDFSGKTPARLEYLAEYEDENRQLISPYLPESAQIVINHHEDLETAKTETDLQLSWAATYQTKAPELRPLLQPRLDSYRLSASDLTAFIDLAYAGPLKFYLQRIIGAPPEPATEQIVLGNLLHATFEQVTNQGYDDAAAIEFFQNSTTDQPLEPAKIDQIRAKGTISLTTALQTFGGILRAPGARAEVNLAPEHPYLDEVPLTGKIDHLQIDDQAKTIEVYDFKTGNYHSEKWDAHPMLYKYRLQLGFYKLLLNHSRTYANYTVTRGHILFVTPDSKNDGQVYDRTYEFNDKDEQELIALIKAVYTQIKTLAFLSDPDLAREADPSVSLRQIKDFVQLIIARS